MRKTCSEAPMRRLKLHGPTMATRWSLICDVGPEVDEPALHRNLAVVVDEVDRQMSPWKPESELTRLNASPVDTWVSLPPAILEVLARALEISRLSDGAFDPAVGTLVDAWGFGPARDEPDAQAIGCARSEDGRPAHNWLELDLTAGRARKHARMQLDLCGIAKGYAVDRMIAVVQTHEVEHALAALGTATRALGHQGNGEPWAIALESPQYTQRTTRSVIELADLAVATSGDYRALAADRWRARRPHHGWAKQRPGAQRRCLGYGTGQGRHQRRRLGHGTARQRPQRWPRAGATHGTGSAVAVAS